MSDVGAGLSLDIVIPFFDEARVLPQLFERLEIVFSERELKRMGVSSVRCLFIDDGSKDDSARLILSKIEKNPSFFTLVRLSRNFGHQAAITAGLEYSTADVVAIIDADLQDPPEVIPLMVEKWRTGVDIVYGVRSKRKEGILKRTCYWAFYRLLKFLADFDIAVDSGDFCLMDRKAVDALCNLPERVRFPRGLRSWIGFKQEGLVYERAGRAAGTPKYRFKELYRLATDGVVSVSIRPLQITQVFSFIFALLLLGFGVVAFYQISQSTQTVVSLWFLAGYGLTTLSSFSILLCLHIISGYLARTYLESKGRPTYIVSESIGARPERTRVGAEPLRPQPTPYHLRTTTQ